MKISIWKSSSIPFHSNYKVFWKSLTMETVRRSVAAGAGGGMMHGAQRTFMALKLIQFNRYLSKSMGHTTSSGC